MSSILALHRSTLSWFNTRTDFCAEILRDLMGEELSHSAGQRAFAGPSAFDTRLSKDLAADTVILYGSDRDVRHGIIVEAQQERLDKKRFQIGRYAAAPRSDDECPAQCPSSSAITRPPPPGTRSPSSPRPRVYFPSVKAPYPSRGPRVTDPLYVAAHPSLAALSVAFHGRKPAVFDAFHEGVAALGEEAGSGVTTVYGYRRRPR